MTEPRTDGLEVLKSLVLPIVLLAATQLYSCNAEARERQSQYVDLAITILSESSAKPAGDDADGEGTQGEGTAGQNSVGALDKWALDVLERYSPVPFGPSKDAVRKDLAPRLRALSDKRALDRVRRPGG